MTETAQLVTWLRAAGEATRMRLLALCAQRDFSVSDLARAVGQSEPRVSRHLKILGAAGLVTRLRYGQWVHYRLTEEPDAARFARRVLAELNRADPLLERDRGRLDATPAVSPACASESRIGRTLAAFLDGSLLETPARSALLIGAAHLELVASAARVARECTVAVRGRRLAQAAKAFVEREGVTCQVIAVLKGETLERHVPRPAQGFEAVVLDRLGSDAASLGAVLASARRMLAHTGRLRLFERCESVVELRRVLAEAGFACERLSPIEIDGVQILAAVAAPAPVVRAVSVA